MYAKRYNSLISKIMLIVFLTTIFLPAFPFLFKEDSRVVAEEVYFTLEEGLEKTVSYYVYNKSELQNWKEVVALKEADIDLLDEKWTMPNWENNLPETEDETVYLCGTVLGMLAAGDNPTNIASRNLINEIINRQDSNTGGFGDNLNDTYYAIRTLDKAEAEGISINGYNAEKAVQFLINNQANNGSFNWASGEGTPDTTGDALVALANHTDVEGVNSSIEAAVSYLKTMQNENAGFDYGSYGEDSGTIACVIRGLVASGKDVTGDLTLSNDWKKNDKTMIDALFKYQSEEGFFPLELGGNSYNLHNTAKSLLAISALINEGSYSNYIVRPEQPTGSEDDEYVDVKVRIEGPDYTILPDTLISVDSGLGYAEILIAGQTGNGYTVEYTEGEYGKFINSINEIAGDPYWMTAPWQEGYYDGDSFVFSGNGSTNLGEICLPDPAEVVPGNDFTVTVINEAEEPVEGATVIYYTEDQMTNPTNVGTTNESGQLTFSIPIAGTYYIAADKSNTAEWPAPDNGLVRTEAKQIHVGNVDVKVRIEGPDYTILPDTLISVDPGLGYAEILIAGQTGNGYTVEYTEGEYGKFINSINEIAGDPYWMTAPWQEGYYDGDSFVFSGNGSTNLGEICLPNPAEVVPGNDFTVTVINEAEEPVEGATVIYYTEDQMTNPTNVGITNESGQLTFSIPIAGTYYIAADKSNTAEWPAPDNGLVRTEEKTIEINSTSSENTNNSIDVQIAVVGQNNQILKNKTTVTLSESSKYGKTVLGALEKTGLQYDDSDPSYIPEIAGQRHRELGSLSGWKFKVIGKETQSFATTAVDMNITDGDRIIWWYATLANEEGPSWNNLTGGTIGHGDSGGNIINSTTTINQDPTKTGDEIVEEIYDDTQEEVVISIENRQDNKVSFTPKIVEKLAEGSKTLTLDNEEVKLEFTPKSLITQELTEVLEEENTSLELGAKEVTAEVKEDILDKAKIGQSTGLFEVGGKVFDFSAQITQTNEDGSTSSAKIESFAEPVKVCIDLSDANLTEEDIIKLTGIRYEKDALGNINPVKLGGTYNPETKTFTFYTDKFSLYGVLKAENLVKITLGINRMNTIVNGETSWIDNPPTIVNNRTMVPLRFVAEALGADVKWIGETRTVEIMLDGKKLSMVIDETGPNLDTPPTIIGDRTFVPIRYVSESFGANVMWFSTTRTVEIVK